MFLIISEIYLFLFRTHVKYLKFMKPEETIFDGISDSEMESISGGIAEVQSESQSESAAGDGYAVKCCNNKLKTKDEEKVKPD